MYAKAKCTHSHFVSSIFSDPAWRVVTMMWFVNAPQLICEWSRIGSAMLWRWIKKKFTFEFGLRAIVVHCEKWQTLIMMTMSSRDDYKSTSTTAASTPFLSLSLSLTLSNADQTRAHPFYCPRIFRAMLPPTHRSHCSERFRWYNLILLLVRWFCISAYYRNKWMVNDSNKFAILSLAGK